MRRCVLRHSRRQQPQRFPGCECASDCMSPGTHSIGSGSAHCKGLGAWSRATWRQHPRSWRPGWWALCAAVLYFLYRRGHAWSRLGLTNDLCNVPHFWTSPQENTAQLALFFFIACRLLCVHGHDGGCQRSRQLQPTPTLMEVGNKNNNSSFNLSKAKHLPAIGVPTLPYH